MEREMIVGVGRRGDLRGSGWEDSGCVLRWRVVVALWYCAIE